MKNPLRRAPRGGSWVAALVIALVIFFLGKFLLGMFINIAFSLVSLAIHILVFVFILSIILYGIRAVAKSEKAESK